MDYPIKQAAKLANDLKKFRAMSEQDIYSELNVNAQEQMREVVRQIDWTAFNTIINQLEYCDKQSN